MLLLLALTLAATAMLRLSSLRNEQFRPGRDPAAVEAVFLGDALYRLGQFVQAQSLERPDVAWYPGYVLEQMGLARYERHARGPQPDVGALLRLGMIYSRSGYQDQGKAAFEHAAQRDSARYPLYQRMADLYGPRRSVAEDLDAARMLLAGQPRWLWLMVNLDLAQAQGEETGEAQEVWDTSLRHFGLAAVAAGVVLTGLIAAGVIVALLWLLRWLVTLPPLRYRAPLRVPWNLGEALEAFVILFFLVSLINVLLPRLLPRLEGQSAGGVWPAAVVGMGYLVYLVLALAFPYGRARQAGGETWRLLGFRTMAPGRALGHGLRAYALFWALMALPLKVYFDTFLTAANPLLSAGDNPWVYLVYFVLMCLAAPIAEEVVFRGFIYAGIRRSLGTGSAALLSGMAFATVHFPAGATQFVFLAALGLTLAVLYERTRSLWPGIVLHVAHNVLVFGVVLAVLAL